MSYSEFKISCFDTPNITPNIIFNISGAIYLGVSIPLTSFLVIFFIVSSDFVSTFCDSPKSANKKSV
jgi:hypothetical protein